MHTKHCINCRQSVAPQSPLKLGRIVALGVVVIIFLLIAITHYAGIGVAVAIVILFVIAKIVMEGYRHSRWIGWICPICTGKDWGKPEEQDK